MFLGDLGEPGIVAQASTSGRVSFYILFILRLGIVWVWGY